MKKIHYNKDGFICNRYPHDYPTDDEDRFIEVDDDVFDETLFCQVGYIWSVVNGKPELTLDPDETETKKRLDIEKGNQLATLKAYLSETDYVISKLNELKLDDDGEYEKARAEYAEVLTKRKEARKRINELEAEGN